MTDSELSHDPLERLREVRERLVDVENQVRTHRQHGWRPDALRATVEETSRLQEMADAASPGLGEHLSPLQDALQSALSSPMMPNADVAARLQELAQEALAALPSEGGGVRAGARASGAGVNEEPFRVMIVEDDRSQAIFAQAILRGAGMKAEVIADPREVMAALEVQQPELVLMDLHMPAMSGTALIALIREHPRFMHMPVVFLTGDQDPERQLEVLEHGGDDYILKPVRPRHLIAAVQSRMRRARALQRLSAEDAQPQAQQVQRLHPVTGLHTRPALLELLQQALTDGQAGTAMLIEIGNVTALRNRFGYAGFDRLMNEASQLLGKLAAPHPAARLSDNAFLVACTGLADEAQVQSNARRLRDGLAYHDFHAPTETLRMRCSIGIADYRFGEGDPQTLLAAAESAARQAAIAPIGLATHAPRDEAAPALAALLADLRGALEAGALALVFQPVVAVAGDGDAQFQVLLRLKDRDGKLRSAGELLPVAERAGLLPEVDRAVLRQALGVLKERHAHGRKLRLFVTQSTRTMLAADYVEWLNRTLDEVGADAGSLVIEVRVDDAVVHATALRPVCDALSEHGAQFCLSQYLHSADNARVLHDLPLGYMKLAANYARHPLSDALRGDLRAAIDLAHANGLKVIGPQVEGPQAAAALWMAGIDYIQGNLVQKAEHAPEFDFQHAVL